jgi:signal transduction histidine kinase
LLYIEDKGKGIPSQKLWEMQVESLRGVGLPGMRERVRQLGGEFELTSDSEGTKLSVKFPLPA